MNIRRIIVMVALLTFFCIGYAYADEDNGVTIDGFSADKTVAKWGDTVTFTIHYKAPWDMRNFSIKYIDLGNGKSLQYDTTNTEYNYDSQTEEGTIVSTVKISPVSSSLGIYEAQEISVDDGGYLNYGDSIFKDTSSLLDGQSIEIQTHRGSSIAFDKNYNDSDLINAIEALQDGECGVVRCYDNLVRKTYLKALKGKNATLIVFDDYHIVEINGADIINETQDYNIGAGYREAGPSWLFDGVYCFSFESSDNYPGKVTHLFYGPGNRNDFLEAIQGQQLYHIDENQIIQGSEPIKYLGNWIEIKTTHESKKMYSTSNIEKLLKPYKIDLDVVTGGKKRISLRWVGVSNEITNVTKYQVAVSTKKSFKKKMTVVKEFEGEEIEYLIGPGRYKSKSQSHKVKGLKAKKKYFVRVRACWTLGGEVRYSDWSKVKSVKTK